MKYFAILVLVIFSGCCSVHRWSDGRYGYKQYDCQGLTGHTFTTYQTNLTTGAVSKTKWHTGWMQ